MKVFLSLLLIFLWLKSSLIDATELTVVTENYPPFITYVNSEISGIVTTAVLEILAISEIKYRLELYPWARSYQLATSNDNVLIYSIYKTPERIPHFHWFCPIYKSSPIFVYKLTSNPINITSLSALKKVKLGILRHDLSHEYLRNRGFVSGKNLDISATENISLKKLVNGRIDAVIQSSESIKYRMKELAYKHISLTKGLALFGDKPMVHCMALSLDSSPKLIDKVSHAFEQWQQIQLND